MRVPVEVATEYAGSRSAAPGCETTITASIESRSGSSSINAWTPAAPADEPLTEASTYVCSWLTRNALASSIRIPVAAALEAAPGALAESRGAAITIVRSASPGRVRRTFRSETSSPSLSVASKVCSLTAPAGMSPKRVATRSATAASPSLPGSRSGLVVAIWRAIAAARSPSKVLGGVTGSSAAGAPSSENMTTTTASRAGRNESR